MITFEINMELKILSKAKAKEFKSLSKKKDREEKGLFSVEGEKAVLDSIESFYVENLITTRHWIDTHPEILSKFKDRLLIADNKMLGYLSSMSSSPEVIAILKVKEEKINFADLSADKLYLLLDEIQDPGNLGTIIRTCDWFGVYDIFASKNSVDVYSQKVVQASMGSLSRVSVHYTDLEELIKSNPGLKVIGTLLNSTPINEIDIPKGGFLLMGNEGRGISESLKKLINISVTIPPVNKKSHPDSLNVAIATAILLSSIKMK